MSRFSGSHAHPAAHQTVRGTSGDRIPGIRAFGYPLGAKCLSRRSIPQNTFQKKVLREKRSKDYAKLPLPRKESHAVSAIPCECAQKNPPVAKMTAPIGTAIFAEWRMQVYKEGEENSLKKGFQRFCTSWIFASRCRLFSTGAYTAIMASRLGTHSPVSKSTASNNRIHTKLVDTSAISGRAKAA